MKKVYNVIGILVLLVALYFAAQVGMREWQKYCTKKEALAIAERVVSMHVSPPFVYSFEFMEVGVLQHLDRDYTYDVVPQDLLDGILFQGVHRPPKGTAIRMELFFPVTIYFFFHYKVDGGYSEIFPTLTNWKKCDDAPQYDIHNGDHGLKMVMYKMDAEAGVYTIPPTTKDRACFSIVFQKKK